MQVDLNMLVIHYREIYQFSAMFIYKQMWSHSSRVTRMLAYLITNGFIYPQTAMEAEWLACLLDQVLMA